MEAIDNKITDADIDSKLSPGQVQKIAASGIDGTKPDVVTSNSVTKQDETRRVHTKRELPKLPSKIPVRRDYSSPPSLPSSGRSTPSSFIRPAMKREGSSPPGLMTTPKQRPPIAPKPTHSKISQKLSLPLGATQNQVNHNMPAGGRGRPLISGSRSSLGQSQIPPPESLSHWDNSPMDQETASGRSTPSSSLTRLSKIPRPDKILKKWDSTSRLEMQRRNSDLNETNLRKRALTHTSSVNLPRSMSESTRSLSSSNTNLVRSVSGSISNLARTSPRMVRSSSSSSFSTVEFAARTRQLQESMVKSQGDLSQDAKIKSQVKRNLGLATKQKSNVTDQVGRLKQELEDAQNLVKSLRAEVEQKEHIAAIAVNKNQDSATDYEAMYKALVKEHSKLASLSKSVEDKNAQLESDLRDAKDSAELLEFRLLELEQRESRERTPELPRRVEKGTEMDNISLNSFNGDSGCSSLTTVDELLDIQKDFRNEKIGDTKTRLHQLMDHIPEPSGKSLLLQTVALFETLLSKIQSMKKENETMTAENVRLSTSLEVKCSVEDNLKIVEGKLQSTNEELQETLQKLFSSDRKFQELKLDIEKKEATNKQILERQLAIESDLKREVENLQGKLQSAKMGFQAESEMYQESLEKFAQQERCITELEAKVSDLHQENAELSLQLKKRRESISSEEFHHAKNPSVLSDSSFEHATTKTTGSSSGVSSDLSDSDNDTSEPGNNSPSQEFIRKEQFIESGIFEEMNCMEQGTQTIEVDQQMSKLNEEIIKLTKFRNMVEQRVTPPIKEKHSPMQLENQESPIIGRSREPHSPKSSTPSSLCKISEYGSCEELEMINGSGRYDQREELKTLSAKLKDMEQKWEVLYTQHQEVVEERCELEEAENDSRLKAQKLEMQYAGALERSQIIKEELILERQTSDELKFQLEEYMNKDERNQEDLESLQIHIQEQEQVIRDLEDREMYYSEQLHLLNMGVKISNWWKTWSWLLINEEEEKPVEDEVIPANTPNKQEVKVMLEDQIKSVSAIKIDFEQKELDFANQIRQLQDEYDLFLDEMSNILWGNNYSNEFSERKEEIIKKVKLLLQNELTLKKQVNDLEKKETAYSKTIQEADTIMARVEYSYQERIKELEQEKHDLKEKIWSLEENSSTTQNALDDQKDEMKTISELIEKLTQVEKSESNMKEKIQDLEKYSEDMKAKLSEREIANVKIKHELKDQDELVKRICDMDNENQELTQEINRLKDVEQKLAELRKTEELLRNRLVELEESEKALKLNISRPDQSQKTTDVIYQEAITVPKDEITTKSTSVTRIRSETEEVRDKDEALKKQVNTLKLQIKDLESDVETKSAELDSIEYGYRSEVSTSNQNGFFRYRSMRDHTGRFFLLVKIR